MSKVRVNEELRATPGYWEAVDDAVRRLGQPSPEVVDLVVTLLLQQEAREMRTIEESP